MRRAGRGRRRDARGVHPRRASRARRRSTSTAVAREVHRPAGRPLELPRVPRVPGGRVHVAERRDRARHPERRRRARGGRHPLDRLRGDHRGLARRRRGDRPDRRDRRRVEAAHRGHAARRSRRRSSRSSRATGSATSAPRSRASPRRPGSRWCGSTSVTASAPRCTRTRRCRTTGRPGEGMKLKEGHVLAIEPMVNAGSAEHRGARRRLDRRHPRRPASAHFEHTIAVTDHGPEVLTLPW